MYSTTRSPLSALTNSDDNGRKEERREAERYTVNSKTSCPFVLPIAEDIGPARIQDISTEGIGFLLAKPVEPGTLICIGLMSSADNRCRTQVIQIVHCTKILGGTYRIGGSFLTPLAYEELRSYLM